MPSADGVDGRIEEDHLSHPTKNNLAVTDGEVTRHKSGPLMAKQGVKFQIMSSIDTKITTVGRSGPDPIKTRAGQSPLVCEELANGPTKMAG